MQKLETQLWHRVAPLRPRLRAHVNAQRRVTRGKIWYLLCDDVSRRYHRVDASAYEIVGRLDGDSSVDEIWRFVHDKLGEEAPTQDETLRVLSHLNDAQLISPSPQLDPTRAIRRRTEVDRRVKSAAANPLAFKVRLFDPTRLLDRVQWLARIIFTPWTA